jgi:hypothetical protein
MNARLASGDLDDWSRRRDSDGHLPTLVRRLIMATVRPDWIRMPAAEGVALSGLDGVVRVSGGAPPYVPAGDSVWELGTKEAKKAKATEDYEKRTDQTPLAERKQTTYVCVTSRRWGAGAKWVTEMKARGDGWKDIVVLAADELALWLEDCPGVEAWLREHLGKGSLGDIGISDWFARWSKQTEPPTPAGVLTAGRRKDVIRLLDAFDTTPDAVTVAASSVEEAVAFVAAALHLGPEPLPQPTGEAPANQGTQGEDGDQPADAAKPDPAIRRSEHLEALRERTIVILDEDGWRRWSAHAAPHILIPLFVPDSVADAIDAGHHVVLPQAARAARENGRLLPLDPHAATTAWQSTGVDFYKAQAYALASRRNLGSLRRRMNRYGRQTPEWANGPSAALLASALLAGAWEAETEGDCEVLLSLTGADTWRNLVKDLTPLTVGEDAPLGVLEHRWDFVDIIDAWDALKLLVTSDDLDVFQDAVKNVLTDADPDAGLTAEERFKLSFDKHRPRRKYSRTLRRGLATTLAILGATVSTDSAAGTRTGQDFATLAVRNLLNNADASRWHTLVDELQLLAEAAPEAFLDAVEASLRDQTPTVMALFDETNDSFGGSQSSHSSLLWALEALAFSPKLVSRVCVILACLAVLDPGGRLANRPAKSLVSVLNFIRPDGAIDATNRFDVIDAVIAAVPDHSADLLNGIIENRGTGIIHSGPRYRDWFTPRPRSPAAEYRTALTEACSRLLTVPTDALPKAADLIGRFASADLARLLDMLTARWDELGEHDQVTVLDTVAKKAEGHRRYSDARWAMAPTDLAAVEQFLTDHGYDLEDDKDEALFSWAADIDDHRTPTSDPAEGTDATEGTQGTQDAEPAKSLDERRRDVVRALLADGLPKVIAFAENVEVPGYVGKALAEVSLDTTTGADRAGGIDPGVLAGLDAAVLDNLGDGTPDNTPPGAPVAWGYTVHKAKDFTWLTTQVAHRPTQAAHLLMTIRTTLEVLDIVNNLEPDQRAAFWSRVSPYRTDAGLTEPFCDALLAAGRPFSAMVAANVRDEPGPSAELIVRVLSAPLDDTTEDPRTSVHSLDYVIGRLLDRLENLDAPDDVVSMLEFRYLPLLDHHREPRALHRELARKPELFAEAVRHIYKPDTEPDTEPADIVATDPADMSQERFRFSDAYFRLLHSWTSPLPGTITDGEAPTAEAVQTWVTTVRDELTRLDRSYIASHVIGEALASPTTDPDGTWPCEAVRTVLESEQDSDLEDLLVVGRLNQRGISSRTVYAGGDQERALSTTYTEWANKVRNRWPRAGALLERLAEAYNTDARREDTAAERDARGLN